MNMLGRPRSLARLLPVLVACALVASCGFRTLKSDLEMIGQQASLEGTVAGGGGPIVVVVHGVPGGEVVDLFLLPSPGQFLFTLPAGSYRVGAFEDHNRDLSHQATEEPAVVFRAPEVVALRPGERMTGIALVIDPTRGTTGPLVVDEHAEPRHVGQLPALQLGTVVEIDDPRFSHANGKLGLWDPLRFLFDVGAGVYFLEPYHPDKIPVLFIHGATGHPGDWKYLIERLDRERFQPWLVYYPTAAHLDRVATGVGRAVAALQFQYGITRIAVVAHSMGGLVARAILNHAMTTSDAARLVEIPAFISISTPWSGHSAAAEGARHAPVVAPSWEDMAPGSPFLIGLLQTPLPSECDYTLIFSFAGGSALGGDANDGSVTLASQLWLPMQRDADRVMGFGESHMGILRSSDVSALLNTMLAEALRQ